MSTWSEAEVEALARNILKLLREKAQEEVPERAAIDPRRSPGWLEAARVRAGWIGPTLVLVFEDAMSMGPQATGWDQPALKSPCAKRNR